MRQITSASSEWLDAEARSEIGVVDYWHSCCVAMVVLEAIRLDSTLHIKTCGSTFDGV